jgi:hypothetical protein
MHAELAKDVLRVGEHVHQMRDRRTLVARDIGDAAFQKRLGDRQNPFAAEFLAGADPQLLNLFGERPLSHLSLSRPAPS